MGATLCEFDMSIYLSIYRFILFDLFRVFIFGFIAAFSPRVAPRVAVAVACGTIASSPCPQSDLALRLVIDVGFGIIYCYILRLHLNPLMAQTWPVIHWNQKL